MHHILPSAHQPLHPCFTLSLTNHPLSSMFYALSSTHHPPSSIHHTLSPTHTFIHSPHTFMDDHHFHPCISHFHPRISCFHPLPIPPFTQASPPFHQFPVVSYLIGMLVSVLGSRGRVSTQSVDSDVSCIINQHTLQTCTTGPFML